MDPVLQHWSHQPHAITAICYSEYPLPLARILDLRMGL